jgi:hypothetical protein
MAIRRVLEELEARLGPASGLRDGSGKLEFKRYGDGGERLNVKCKGLDVDDGATLEFVVRDKVVAVMAARKGRAVLDLEPVPSDIADRLTAGESVTLRHLGTVLLTGELTPD